MNSFQSSDTKQILTHPQFLVADVCGITGATPKALEHFVNPKRGLVRLVGAHANPGTGRRRVFTGGQVLMIAAAYAMTRIGFPQRYSMVLADMVERRALNSAAGIAFQSKLTIQSYPMSNGDWACVPLYPERKDPPKSPVAVHTLDVDRLIEEVIAQLRAIVADEEVPDFTVPDPDVAPDYYGPESNTLLAWEPSENGGWRFVGLTDEETTKLLRYRGLALDGDALIDIGEPRDSDADALKRELYLAEKHEIARLKLCAGS